ncbi:MAG TPA: MarR family transcriptional regulator [Candidatus Babeliales bacterium]|nr:MarR family transcriptional regulator [Candidatus Babeliales bacterium]
MSDPINFRHISVYQTPDESPGYLLWRVSMQWRTAIEKALKTVSLTHPQFVVLATLGWLTKDGSKVNQVEIGKMASLDPNTTSQILRGLERKKLIKRINSVDERSKNPMLTPSGKDILTQALPLVEQTDAQFFAKISSDELESFIRLFHQLMR